MYTHYKYDKNRIDISIPVFQWIVKTEKREKRERNYHKGTLKYVRKTTRVFMYYARSLVITMYISL